MRFWLIAAGVLSLSAVGRAEQTVDFNRDVRPILSDRCFPCHGPNEHDRQADLRLDRSEGPDGASHVIVPASVDESELWRRISSEDDDVMPPPDSPQKPLSPSEQLILRRWIEQGALYQDFWAFIPPRSSALPGVEDSRSASQAIDRFVRHRLEAEGLVPSAPADRRTLIRRLTFDLTGLPPSREEIQEFLSDTSTDAYERLVDRLLARTHYGEHMAKYWLDLVRFADTNGIHHDHYREMSPYRDWVIRAFNENLPYDKFVTYQLAGDLYPEPTRDQLIASGFHRLHLIIDRGTALPEESYTRNVVDRVTAVGTAFLGLTVQCAMCHDHKYDPITAKDFYQLFAFFNNLDAEPETGGRDGTDFERGLQPPYISLADELQQSKIAELDHRMEQARSQVAHLQQKAGSASDDAAREPLDAELKQAQQALEELETEKRTFEAAIPMAMVMKERADIRPAYVLVRGAYDKPGDRVERNSLSFLPPMKKKEGLTTRMDLAEWFMAPEHPLTARVAVNRFWQQLFGVGIVKTSEDFGAQGEWPSHPELLDYLATSFIESQWDIKALVKQIVMSQTYQQTSQASVDHFTHDPENRLLARGSRFRMDSEMIRDQVLATSGLLNDTMYGKSVKPPQPPGLWDSVSMPSSYPSKYEQDTGDKIYRRSVYTFWKRAMPPPQMTILNAPTRESCIARRERTNTPLQALLLMNEPEFLKAARHLTHRTMANRALTPTDRLQVLYETLTAQLPDAEEIEVFLALVEELESIYRDNSDLAEQLCEGAEFQSGESAAELAAWTILASTLYNLDITKTRN